MPSDDVVLVAACRSPFGKFGGALADVTLPDLGGAVVAEAVRRAGVAPDEVDEVALGVNLPGSDRSIARQTALVAGVADDKVAYTVDRACCSSLAAITMASWSLRLGESAVAVAGGVENMSRVPYFLEPMRWGARLGDVVLKDQLVISCPYTGVPRAQQAADEAAEYGIGREAQDEWALGSQRRWAAADARGAFDDELTPVVTGDGSLLERDESPRPQTTIEDLARLPTVNGSATVTAGNAPGLSSGATAVVLMSRGEAVRRNLTPLATLVASTMVSGHPARIASIPAVAARKVLQRSGHSIDDVDLIEINEAFAAVPLVATAELAGSDDSAAQRLRERLNVNGGAIALGHPTGATAARLVMTAAFELRRRGGGLALVAICGGIGEAAAALVRVEPGEPVV